MEVWKKIPGYEDYEVSSLGRVKSFKYNFPRLLRAALNKKHLYLCVSLSNNGKSKTFLVHQLVAMAFLGHIPSKGKIVVNHINYNRQDNRLENLNLVTHRVNCNKKHLETTSKYTGVHWDKVKRKYRASLFLNGTTKQLGYFKCEKKAHNRYLLELKKHNIKI